VSITPKLLKLEDVQAPMFSNLYYHVMHMIELDDAIEPGKYPWLKIVVTLMGIKNPTKLKIITWENRFIKASSKF
jgi:hypothetical protein